MPIFGKERLNDFISPSGRNGTETGTDGGIQKGLAELTSITDREGEDAAVATAGAGANLRSRLDSEQFERATRGMDLSDRQRKAAGRRLGLARTINRASAQGEVRRGFTDRSEAAASSGASFGDALFAQTEGGETGIIGAAQTLKTARERASASSKAGTMGAVGAIIGGALSFFSSEDLKHDHGHEGNLLEKLKKVRVNRWQYKGDDKTHVGPFSEEFNREFGIDTDRPDMIGVIDALGVTMGAIKELDKKVSANASR